MKLLRQKYKTWDGANKAARFENGIARGDYERGDKAKIYRYTVVLVDNVFRVQRDNGTIDEAFEARAAASNLAAKIAAMQPLTPATE